MKVSTYSHLRYPLAVFEPVYGGGWVASGVALQYNTAVLADNCDGLQVRTFEKQGVLGVLWRGLSGSWKLTEFTFGQSVPLLTKYNKILYYHLSYVVILHPTTRHKNNIHTCMNK